MRVSKADLAAHHDAILTAASRLFRARGVAGAGVAEVMREAGLTHGGFYCHYASKAELAAAACRPALAEGAARWRRRAARARAEGRDPVAAIAEAYLSQEHLQRPDQGCALPTLAAEATRSGPPLETALADGARGLLAVLAEETGSEAVALAVLSALVGGVVVARACADSDLASRTLAAARRLVAAARDLPKD
jgi:TetR/AcrR family transcriptional repressor of nem operon